MDFLKRAVGYLSDFAGGAVGYAPGKTSLLERPKDTFEAPPKEVQEVSTLIPDDPSLASSDDEGDGEEKVDASMVGTLEVGGAGVSERAELRGKPGAFLTPPQYAEYKPYTEFNSIMGAEAVRLSKTFEGQHHTAESVEAAIREVGEVRRGIELSQAVEDGREVNDSRYAVEGSRLS